MDSSHIRGVSWGGRAVQLRAAAASALAALTALLLLASPGAAVAAVRNGTTTEVSVIVRGAPADPDAAASAVRAVGGRVERELDLIHGVAAKVPVDALGELRRSDGVATVTEDAPLTLHAVDGFDPKTAKGSMLQVVGPLTEADRLWRDGHTGAGIDVALIDSGVAEVNGLTTPGKVLHGPDLSFESQDPELHHVDTFGHGTHLAGIIAGRDDNSPAKPVHGDADRFWGMAPDARIVSLKVADAQGHTDVSQVIAAIDWVVQHRVSDGLNIRVLNLSFGTDSVQDYRLDPLSFAAEVAWRKGIVVVVAAGNDGEESESLQNPAINPFVIAVGAADGNGTPKRDDDVVASYSSRALSGRTVDLVAPGASIVSLRAPGSTIEALNPAGHEGTRFMRGSGTSQAAAVVSGAAALLLSQRPELTPDQVKAVLLKDARPLKKVDARAQGAGMVLLKGKPGPIKPEPQRWEPSTGLGSLDAARGSVQLVDDAAELTGEVDIFGQPFDSAIWAEQAEAGTSWADGRWNANRWSGAGWSGNRWSSAEWTANRWSGNRWSSELWSANRWSANRWSANRWSANRWSSAAWR